MEKWFVKRRKSKTLDLAQRQIRLAIDTVTELERSVIAASSGDKKETERCLDRLFLIEVEIDDLRRSVFEESTRGNMPPNDREDIMHLVKRLDLMADHVKDSARSVKLLTRTRVPKEIWDFYVGMAKDLVECATTLERAIERLGTNPHEAEVLSKKVDEIEGKIDEKYFENIKPFHVGEGIYIVPVGAPIDRLEVVPP